MKSIISRHIYQIITILLKTVIHAMKAKYSRVGNGFYLCSSLAIGSWYSIIWALSFYMKKYFLPGLAKISFIYSNSMNVYRAPTMYRTLSQAPRFWNLPFGLNPQWVQSPGNEVDVYLLDAISLPTESMVRSGSFLSLNSLKGPCVLIAYPLFKLKLVSVGFCYPEPPTCGV